jgi:hypothetical protein
MKGCEEVPKWIKQLGELGDKAFLYLIEDVPLAAYVSGFVFVVLAFGFAYAALTPHGHGLAANGQSLEKATFMQGSYFSVVTVSSLGYGDMHPVGASKVLACLEVLFGLLVMGIMIAKATSRRLSYHVSRLFSSDAHKRLDDFASDFAKSAAALGNIAPQLAGAYPIGPNKKSPIGRDAFLGTFHDVVGMFTSQCSSLSEYWVYETSQGKYFSIAPTSAVRRVGEELDSAFMRLVQLIISLPPEARADALTRHTRQQISDSISCIGPLCKVVQDQTEDGLTSKLFARIEETVSRVPSSYFTTAQDSQPDQAVPRSEVSFAQSGEASRS